MFKYWVNQFYGFTWDILTNTFFTLLYPNKNKTPQIKEQNPIIVISNLYLLYNLCLYGIYHLFYQGTFKFDYPFEEFDLLKTMIMIS